MSQAVAAAGRSNAWFPSSTTVKCTPLPAGSSCSLLLFYHYVEPMMTQGKVDHLKKFLVDTCTSLSLGGRLRVAKEGLNCTLSGPSSSLRTFADSLQSWGSSGPSSRPPFQNCDNFKYVDSLPPDRHFSQLTVLPVQELVYYGVRSDLAPLSKGGTHLPASEYHELMSEPNTVIIDVRNNYEADIGRFSSSDQSAVYVNPKMRKSTDFKGWLEKEETREKVKGKKVLMYCTGGVRCERASALLNAEMGSEIEGVYQLKGGIEAYLKEFPEGGYWEGKNFVFDKREAFGVGCEGGVGGVVKKKDKKKKKKSNKKSSGKDDEDTKGEKVLSSCCVCGAEWDRYVGKKKCYTCGVPVLMCDGCMTEKPDKTDGRRLEVRCGLCKEEGVEVPANDLEFTDNGVGVVTKKRGGGEGGGKGGGAKAAQSVLKWGGGVAKDKKKMRQMKRKLCKFGAECTRKDCWFSHGREGEVGVGVGGAEGGCKKVKSL